jgi:hypothetical protein
MLLIDPTVPKPRLLHAMLHHLNENLAGRNRLASSGTQVRLRVVLHGGEVGQDPDGVHGTDLDAAFRMLDAGPLRAALAASYEPVAVAVSDFVYQGTVRHGFPGIPRDAFHRAEFEAKEGTLPIWVYGPEPAEAAAPGPAGAEASVAHDRSVSVSFSAGTVHGDQFTGGKHIYGDRQR